MAKKTINLGAGELSGDGESIRSAFSKINENFDEIYAGEVLDLSEVDQHILPAVTDTYDLGSPDKQWRSLYLTGSTVYFNGIPLSVTDDGTILVNNEVAATPGGELTWDSITGKPTIPTNTNQLTNGAGFITSTNQLVNGEWTVSLGSDGTLIAPSAIAFGDGNWSNISQVNDNFVITTNTGAGNPYSWTFDGFGNLTLPGGAVIDTYNNGGEDATYLWSAPGEVIAVRSMIDENAFGGGIDVRPDGSVDIIAQNISSASWRFNENGSLTFPNLTTQTTAFTGTADIARNIESEDDVSIKVNLTDSTQRVWRFGEDGDLTLPAGGDIVDSNGNSVLGGGAGGLPTVTIPAEPIVLYKGLQASYGVIHSNGQSDEFNVNKIVIHKPATTAVTIDPTGNNDDFQISGIGNSDVLAMFVVYGDINGPKPLTSLQNFTRAVIDNVILAEGQEGVFNTVDQMKTLFYGNYQILASAANGLYSLFEFYSTNALTLNGGPTTVREGSGTVDFTIFDNGDGTYTIASVSGGANYLTGHKIKILGTAVGGVTPDNDIIVTVVATNGEVVAAQEHTGLAAGNTFTQYFGVTGTNYNVGSGFTVYEVYTNGLSVSTYGTNYVVGDVITLLGENITGGTTPENNITITVTNVGGLGEAYGYNTNGTLPEIWPTNSISDGGADQYDTANYINTNLANEINYNGGNTVVDGTAAFGAGSTYSFVYDTAIFGLFVTGNGATSISTSGNSGADGSSTTETGYVFGGGTAAETFDNAVTHINILGEPWAGPIVSFTKADYGDEIDILIADNGQGAGVGITRSNQNGIYNPYREEGWNSSVSPDGTLWNIEGWNDLTDIESRAYVNFYEAFGGGLGNRVINAECVMYLPDNGKYYAVKFEQWTQGINGQEQGGGFAYTRREIDLTKLQEGIRFADGTRLKSAAGLGRVKLESPGNRRIEEVYGYKQVSVTEKQTINLTATASRIGIDTSTIWINSTTTTIDTILDNTSAAGIWDNNTIEFSLDNSTWYRWNGSTSSDGDERGYSVILPSGTLNYNTGNTVYFRYKTGGDPVTWWDKNELPGGGSRFRGAVIDYHAYTGESTIIGTIHIVDDDGEENITHTEVTSGDSDGENDDLWYVTQEGQIKYRRIDSEAKTLKVQWSAKVFYGSELYD